MTSMTDSPDLTELALLTPRITGAINQMRTFGFYLTNYVDELRRGSQWRTSIESIRFQIDRLIEINENLAGELMVAKEIAQ